MGQSTPIVLGATGVSFANEWYNTNSPNFRVIIAGIAVALILDGVERFSPEGAVGLATITMITVLLTPFSGKSPVQTLAGLAVAKPATAAAPVAATS